jgi:hypothetical protein
LESLFMRNLSQVCLLLGALAWAQGTPAQQNVPTATTQVGVAGEGKQVSTPSAVNIDANETVVTIKGLCPHEPAAGAGKPEGNSCEMLITRAEFEKLANAIQTNMTPTGKRQLAMSYPRILVMSREAEQRGLEKEDRVQQLLAYSRAQILSQELFRRIQEQAGDISQKDIDDYYRTHMQSFERVTLERVLVPIAKEPVAGAASQKPPEEKTSEQDRRAMENEAEQLRQRAVAGEDFPNLQQAAYDVGRVGAPIPRTKLTWRRGSLPAAHLSVMDLKIGEISAVITDSTGHYIYKIDAKEVEPEAEASAEVHTILQKQRAKEMMDKLQAAASTELNQAYFGVPETPKPPDFSKVKPESDDQ